MEQNKHNEDEKIGKILRRAILIFPYFLGMNYENRAVNLWSFVQEVFVDSCDKRKNRIPRHLIFSTVDDSVLSSFIYEFGQINKTKSFGML